MIKGRMIDLFNKLPAMEFSEYLGSLASDIGNKSIALFLITKDLYCLFSNEFRSMAFIIALMCLKPAVLNSIGRLLSVKREWKNNIQQSGVELKPGCVFGECSLSNRKHMWCDRCEAPLLYSTPAGLSEV